MKRNYTFLMAAFALMVCLVMPLGMRGDNYVVQFKSGTTGSDSNQTITSISEIVASGNSYIQSLSDVNYVYHAQSGYGIKLGKSSASGSLTLNLSSTGQVYANSITFNSCDYGTDNSYLYVTINGEEYRYFALTDAFQDYTYSFDAPTLVSSIEIAGSGSKNRFYVKSMTVNYSNAVETVATPTFSLAAGTYTGTQNVSISCATSGATIHYTTDGTTPTSSSTTYSSSIAVTHTTTIKAMAMKSGMANSEVATATYTIESGGTQPTNSYVVDFENALSTYTNWTFENIGTTNTTISAHGGSKYGANINSSGNGTQSASITTTSAIAYPQSLTCYLSKCSTNTTSSNWYVKVRTVNGSWTTVDTHSATSMSKGTWVEFTVDLSAYTNVYVQISYSSSNAIRAIDDITLTAIDPNSPVINATAPAALAYNATSGAINYTITNPVTGTSLIPTILTGSDWISNLNVTSSQVTFDVSTNTTSSDRTGSIKLSYEGAQDNTVNITQGHLDVAAPTFSPAGGDYTTAQTVSISAVSGATIYYTINGDNPTTSSTVYSSPIQISEYSVLKAIAVQNGVSSPIATATYNIVPTINVGQSSFSFPYTASSGSFGFTITNPVSGASVTATADDWITPSVAGNTVSFQVAENTGNGRSGNITLSYMLNGTVLTSVAVTVSQEANPNQPGGQNNPYTVAEAVDATPSSGSSDWVYVRGIVSQIIEIEVMQYHNARYCISDDGGTTSVQLLAFYGRNINNTDFLSEDELFVGDEVVVYGQLKMFNSSTKELDRGNYITSLYRAVEPVTFNPPSCVMTSGSNVSLFSNAFNEWDAEVYYTIDGIEPSTTNGTYFDVWGDLIELTQTTTVKAVTYVPDLNKYSPVTQATYTIVSSEEPGWVGNPYSVSQALDALDQNSNIQGAYVHGIVSRIVQIETTQYYNATYFISDDGQQSNELQVYRGKYISRADFTSQDQLQIGDIVTVFGDLTVYNGTTKEFKPKNYIEHFYRPTSIIISQNQIEVDCNATYGTINVTYSDDILVNAYHPTLQFCDAQGNAASYDWLTVTLNENTSWDLEYVISANSGDQARTAYLKVVYHDTDSNLDVVSNIASITQSEFQIDYATLPFDFTGGSAAIANTVGLKGVNLGDDDYSTSPKLRFDKQNSSLVLKINEVPGVLTYDIQSHSANNDTWTGTFKVQVSTDGNTWIDKLVYLSNLDGTVQSETIGDLPVSTRYIRWIYTTKSGGNVGVGNIHLEKPILYYDIVLNQPQEGGTIVCDKGTAAEGETVLLNANVSEGYVLVDWDVLDEDNNPITVEGDGTAAYSFTMPASDVTVEAIIVPYNTEFHYAFSANGTVGAPLSVTVGNAVQMPAGSNITFNGQTFTFRGWTTNPDIVTNLLSVGSSYVISHDMTFYAVYNQSIQATEAEKHYAKVTRELSDWSGDYLIVYEDDAVAFNGGLNLLDGSYNTISVTISDRIITATETINAAKFTIAAVSNGYTIKSASGKFIGRDNDSNGLDESETTAFVNSISYNELDGQIDIVGTGGAHLRYNSASNQNRFRYFKSTTYTGQKAIQLYKFVGGVSNLYTRIFMNETVDNLTIEGPSLIPDGSVLYVTTVTNTLGANRLVVEEGAQLVTSNDVNATIKRFVNPYQDEFDNYYLVSSPVDGQDPVAADMTKGAFDLYAFDQSAQGAEWQNYEANNFNLAAGQGYLYANNYGGYITMSGLMEATADDVTIEHVSGKNFAGWNLIGNPYPCNVTIDRPYYRLAEGGAALATDATDNSVAIAPMEGVFVYADEEDDIIFTKAPTTSTTGRGRNTLSLRVSRDRGTKGGQIVEDNAIVRFGEGSLLRKLALSPNNAQLYVAQDGTDYAIVNAEAVGELPVSFRAAENGRYTIEVDVEGVSLSYLHLIDNMTGANVDLLQTPSYSFEATTADYTSRFRLVFAANNEDTDGDNETFAYYNGSQWVVSGPSTPSTGSGTSGTATLQVVDMMGRVLSSQAINGTAEVSIHEAQGVYLLRLLSGDSVKVQKIVIKN